MLAIRYLALAALVVWLGGMVVLGLIVVPTTLRVLQDADPNGGHLVAGVLVGELVSEFQWLAYACGGIVLVMLVVMKFLGPPPAAFVVRAAIVASMLAIAVYSGVPVSREVTQSRAGVVEPIDHQPTGDEHPNRLEALHRTATALMAIDVGLGLVLLFWYARE